MRGCSLKIFELQPQKRKTQGAERRTPHLGDKQLLKHWSLSSKAKFKTMNNVLALFPDLDRTL